MGCSSEARLLAVGAAILSFACGGERASAPRPTQVEPARGYAALDVPVVLRGEGFLVRATQEAGGRGASVDTRHRAWLGGVELVDVAWIDDRTLQAVVPAGLPPGPHDLEVENALGRRGSLPAAFDVVAGGPPSLTAVLDVFPPVASLGQEVRLALSVQNLGGAPALGVLPAVVGLSGSGAATPSGAGPVSQDIPPGESRTFTWRYVTSGVGEVTFEADGAGADPLDGATVTVPRAASNLLRVVAPGALSASADATPGRVSVGQTLDVRLSVTNAGGAAVLGVSPTVAATSGSGAAVEIAAPSPRDVPAGGSVDFLFLYSATEAGDVSFSLGAWGTDENDGQPVASPAASTSTVVVETPPSLSTAVTVSPSRVSAGQPVTVTAVVSNGGDATASGVSAAVAMVPAGASPSGPPPSPEDVPGHSSRSFTWVYDTASASSGTFAVDAAGADANSGAVASASRATSGNLVVERPAALAAVATATPSQASVGQGVTVELRVTNTGEASADVTPSLATAIGGALALTPTGPPPGEQSIAGGATATFTFGFLTSGGPGTASFTASATGTDANSGSPVSATVPAGPVVVQGPARLEAAVSATPGLVNQAQSIAVTLTVTNAGEATALGVMPSGPTPSQAGTGTAALASGPVPAGPVTLAGGESQVFSWSYLAQDTGTLSFSHAAQGTDANSGASLPSGVATSAAVQIQRPAALASAFVSAPSRVSLGQTFPVTLSVTDTGDAAASAVAVSLEIVPAGAADGGPAPASADLPGGTSAPFTRSFTAVGLGSVSLQADASGTDATDGRTIAAPRITRPLLVERPAELVASLSLPPSTGLGDFTVAMTVTNVGEATAETVAPGPLALEPSSTASVALVSAPSGTASLAAGQQAVFSWTYSAQTVGTVQLSGVAFGTDANSGAAVSSARTVSGVAVVAEAVSLAVDPFGDGTPFAFLAAYRGQLYLGPNRTGSGLVRMNPDGSAPQSVALAFTKDVNGSGDRSSNDWSTSPSYPPYPSLGASGCASHTAACGPDNENGRGLFASGTLAGTEWLVLGGARSGGDLDYVYMTSDAGSPLVFRYVDLSGFLGGQTRGFSAVHVFKDRVYLGFPDTGGSRPYLLVLLQAPPAPGLDPELGLYASDLAAKNMPGVGEGGSPKNNASTIMIDALADFGDRLYLANNGGFVRSTTDRPRTWDSAPGDWAACTPQAASWAAKVSVTTAKTADLEPADRAVPAFAPFGGRLFAIRNVFKSGAAGPSAGQLWSCNPALVSGPAPASAQACDPGDWSLSVPNTSGDPLLTQLGNPNNGPATLLVATTKYLYLGFDNPVDGLQIFRSAVVPTQLSDFKGQGGCSAGSPACQGLGGGGLGVPSANTRILDAKALGFAGQVHLYVAAGGGASPVRIYHFPE